MKLREILICLLVLPASCLAAEAAESGRSSGVIGRLDTVEVRVFREDELTTVSQLSSNGTLSMPLIGAVKLEGLTTDQAAAAITAKLKDGYLVRPQVSVSIEARLKRTVTILGQAQTPGVFEIPAHRQLTISEAVGLAGGATRIANLKKVTVKSRGSEVRTINLKDITTGKGKDVPLRDGDIITIPESLF